MIGNRVRVLTNDGFPSSGSIEGILHKLDAAGVIVFNLGVMPEQQTNLFIPMQRIREIVDLETLQHVIAALSGTDAAPTAVETYKAENAKNGWTGRGLSFDGGCLNLGKDGSAEFVFGMDDCDPYYEEGKSLMLVKVAPSEIEFLRDYLVKAFPAARTDAATGGGE